MKKEIKFIIKLILLTIASLIAAYLTKQMWSIEHLEQLKELTNHKVIYDGYEFIWQVKLDGKWIRHYVRNFEDYKTPMSWIFFNLSRWNNEYNNRRKQYLKNMQLDLETEIKITEISREASIKTKEKIQQILKLKPNISNKEISNILGVTIKAIEYHKKNIKQIIKSLGYVDNMYPKELFDVY